jgi:methylmalonyl-CoA/ethylmalonyl-CoA epimerase
VVSAPTLPGSVRPYLRGLRHVGVVSEDSEALIARMQALFGVADGEIVRVPGAETRFAFFSIGGLPFEIIEPVSARFRALLLSSGRGVNHVCFNVDDLPAAVAAMRAHGVRLGHVTADGIVELPHARMAYFDPEDTAGVLIEFVEPRG